MSTADDDLRAATRTPRVPVLLSEPVKKAAGRAATRAGLPLASWIGSLVVSTLHDRGLLTDGELTDP